MSNKFNIYKDEFGVYREADEEAERPIDGFEDDDHEHFDDEDEQDSHFDSLEDDEEDEEDEEDEDQQYANEHKVEFESED